MTPFSYAAPMRAATLDFHRTRMLKVQRQIAQHLDEPIDVVALAKVAGLSPRQLERVFTRTVGETPAAYARRLRLERAAVRLRTTRSTILTIAIEAGVESHEAFTRMFRARFGHGPAEFRRLEGVTLQPRARAHLWQLAGAALRQQSRRSYAALGASLATTSAKRGSSRNGSHTGCSFILP